MDEIEPQVVIFGGGAAGLWLLDTLRRDGYQAVLLEAAALGAGQTIASQGIIHGGLKYTLRGSRGGRGGGSRSADAVSRMPAIWRRCLAGQDPPDLNDTQLRAPSCHLWHTGSLTSRLGMAAARSVLRVRPVGLDRDDWPRPLRDRARGVYRLDEQVIEPASFLRCLARRNEPWLLRIDVENGLTFQTRGPGGSLPGAGVIEAIRVRVPTHPPAAPGCDRWLTLRPRVVVLTAGRGNARLRQHAGLSADAMQLRPLHMVVVRGGRGDLPVLNGHCIDGHRTRVTITTSTDSQGRTVWQVGGQVAEGGVSMQPHALVEHAQAELRAVLGGVDLGAAQWATYRVDRAEAATEGGSRPDGVFVRREGNTVTAWPTKLALVPELVRSVTEAVGPPEGSGLIKPVTDWPRPGVAAPPWEQETAWISGS